MEISSELNIKNKITAYCLTYYSNSVFLTL